MHACHTSIRDRLYHHAVKALMPLFIVSHGLLYFWLAGLQAKSKAFQHSLAKEAAAMKPKKKGVIVDVTAVGADAAPATVVKAEAVRRK